MIYLDYNASTPLDPAVREAMLPYLADRFGNPSSSHAAGRPLREAIEQARSQVAELLGAMPDEIVFTSGGTEGCNQIIKGVAHILSDRGKHIITSAVEHPAVIQPCKYLEKLGYEVSYVGVDSTGRVDPQEVAGEVRPTTILISIMHANNEVGTIQYIAEIVEIAHEGGILVHSDAAQSCGKIETRVDRLGVDFLTIAAHKFYGPPGIGATYIRKGSRVEPFHHGAGHQGGRRGGTEPAALIVGIGAAAVASQKAHGPSPLSAGSNGKHAKASQGNGHPPHGPTAMCDRLYEGLKKALAGAAGSSAATSGNEVVLLGHPTDRLPNTLCVGFRGRIGGEVLAACPEICASTGAACHSGKAERSATLAAMDVPEVVAFGAVRFSTGRFTTEDEIVAAIAQLSAALRTH